MFDRILGFLIVIIAVILAVLAVALPPAQITTIILFSRFFEVMIPVLAVGALIKYLLRFKD